MHRNAALPPLATKAPCQYGRGFSVEEFDFSRVTFSPPFEMSVFRVEPHCSSVPESHEDTELWLVAAGTGQLICGDATSEIQPGLAIALPAQTVHQVVNTGAVTMEIFSIWWIQA